jgi:hypothetical protein
MYYSPNWVVPSIIIPSCSDFIRCSVHYVGLIGKSIELCQNKGGKDTILWLLKCLCVLEQDGREQQFLV